MTKAAAPGLLLNFEVSTFFLLFTGKSYCSVGTPKVKGFAILRELDDI